VEIQPSDSAFDLLYLNARGECFTDAWHQTLQQPKAQARREFGIQESDWEEVAPSQPA